MMKKVESLVKRVDQAIKVNEGGTTTIDGVSNLSRTDLEMIRLYCEEYYLYGGHLRTFVRPLGSIKEVLDKNGIVFEEKRGLF